MSAPNRHLKEADYIDYGFLAAISVKTLNKLLQNERINDEELEILSRSADFLEEIANGADLVTTGKYHGSNPVASMKALNFAMDPLGHLQELVQHEQYAQFFRDLSGELASVVDSPRHKVSKNRRELIQHAIMFFRALNESLLNEVQKQKPRVGGRRLSLMEKIS